MGYLVSEQDFLNDNIFKYEERMNSQYTRFLDRTATYVTYYNISNVNSTVDNGFQSVEELVGPNSPIRFNKIDDLPIYGLEQIVLDLNDDEEGLTTDYDGDAIILPNTVKPLPGDFFIINHLKIKVLFMVTDIKFDTIKSNNFYKISFSVKSLSDSDEIERQVSDKFKCISENIGTEDKCLVREEEFFLMKDLLTEYDRLADMYKLLFYNPKFNCFTIKERGINFYDPYLSLFIRKNKLFTSKDSYRTLYPDVIGNEQMISIMYNNSIYKDIELEKKLRVQKYDYNFYTDIGSPFMYYGVQSVHVQFPGDILYIPEEFIIRLNEFTTDLEYTFMYELIAKYIHGQLDTIYAINIDKLKELYIENVDRISMILYAIVLFILKKSYHKFIGIKI